MKGVFFILFSLTIISSKIFSTQIEYTEIDFGDVPIGNKSMPNIKMLPFSILNKSDNLLIIEHMSVVNNYDRKIVDSGNIIRFIPGYIFRYMNGPLEIKPNSSYTMNVSYNSVYVDPISQSGEKLSKSVYIFYRYENETEYNIDSVSFYARSVEGSEIEAFGHKYDFYLCESGSKFISNHFFVGVINKSNSDLKIDSIDVNILGDNLIPDKLIDGDGFETDLLLRDSYLWYQFKYEYKNFENSIGKVRFYASDKNNNELNLIAEDSTVIKYHSVADEGKLSMSNRSIVFYQGESQKVRMSLLTCKNENMVLDTLYLVDNEKDEIYTIFEPFDSFPIFLNTDSNYNAFIEFKSVKPGTRQKQVCAVFSNSNNDKFFRCIDINITVLTLSSIVESEKVSSKFLIYPQPANDVLNIKSNSEFINKIDLIKIYDLYGNLVFQKTIVFGDVSIPISNISSGIYFLQIHSSGNIFNYKIPVSR
ncbi:MAG: T9SS type A sorting domain-containing protein [Candidatus Kapabacteria bacterium]|nr:T9SS type A sorting domain-containing protein [Ignavibacteriota bacterium]MCW5883833.1 T9SS type A sorting domain-containing protein [Candidatus Kapabacteria bacterium]